jgi:RNA polymerase sigma-70 factor (ECF subfamily)
MTDILVDFDQTEALEDAPAAPRVVAQGVVARGQFPDTRWSLVLGAAGADGERALAELCRLYWAPVHDFFCRLGCSRQDARDKTQGFFVRWLERGDLARLDRTKVRWFRSWLRICVKNYYLNELKSERALKRGGGRHTNSFEGDEQPAAIALGGRYLGTDEALDRVWDQCWAKALVERAVARLREHKVTRRRWPLFVELVSGMHGEATNSDDEAIAAELGIKLGSVRVYRFQMRQAFRDCLAREIGAVPDSSSVDEELTRLLAAYFSADGLLQVERTPQRDAAAETDEGSCN